jgi:hypothetical protein
MLSGAMTSRRNADGVLLEAQDDVAAEKVCPGACRPPPSRGQALEPVNRLARALAVGVVYRKDQVGAHANLNSTMALRLMTLEDAAEDQIT